MAHTELISNSSFILIFVFIFFQNGLPVSESSTVVLTKLLQFEESSLKNLIPGRFGELYTLVVSANSSSLLSYSYFYTNATFDGASNAVRVTVSSQNSEDSFPILFVIKQQLGILSWQLPLFTDFSTWNYTKVSRTLCPVENYREASLIAENQEILVDVSTASVKNVTVEVKLDKEKKFTLKVGDTIEATVSPSEPIYYEVQMPQNVNTLKVAVTSNEKYCSIVSIQDPWCPVYDLNDNVQLTGAYQTMTTYSTFIVERKKFPSGKFFVVLVVESSDESCFGIEELSLNRTKTFQISILPTITDFEYMAATFGAIALFLMFYIFALIVTIFYRIKSCIKGPLPVVEVTFDTSSSSYSSHTHRACGTVPGTSGLHNRNDIYGLTSLDSNPLLTSETISEDQLSTVDEIEIDMLPDAEIEKDVFRTKTFLYVSDLARKSGKILSKNSKMYLWTLLTVAIFYGLPVVKLVLTHAKTTHGTGNQDLCYYNFRCSYPYWKFSDFNHVYSNIGYILLGFLFVGLVWRRASMHKKRIEMFDVYEMNYGIPRHFGLFYAMGLALMAEGLFSACYHVCPNYSNFQFDTAFMYVIAGLCMLKVYETRHPDINATAYATFMGFSFLLCTSVIGVLFMNVIFRITFAVIHILACLALSVQVYYMGRWRLNLGIFKRIYLVVKNDVLSESHCVRPMYMDRLILLSLANLINWSLAAYGLVKKPADFPSFLLSIFMVNLVLYVSFYIIMKIRHKEKILPLPMLYIILSFLAWGSSLYFFLQKVKNWEVSPAQSREYNRECLILKFYDDHDIWHFLSAASMFFSFMILLTLDDDLIHTSRQKIPVF